jgi:uncharacterized RDD family membrane protein YckC
MSQEASVQSILACSQCGRTLPQSELVQIAGSWVCGNCKPAFLSRVMASGAASPLAWRYSGFWIRFGARFLDGLILGVPFYIVVFSFMPSLLRNATATRGPNLGAFAMFGLTYFLVFYAFAALYEVLMLKYRAATVGKMACGLKVVTPDGRPLSWGVCVGRFFMWNVVTSGVPYLNLVLMSVSSIMVATDGEKRALHDRVCGTRVIYSRA